MLRIWEGMREDSSSANINRPSITKAGNSHSHIRKLLTEASKGICKGTVGHKSKDLKARQSDNPPEVIAYADKAKERLRRKYQDDKTKQEKECSGNCCCEETCLLYMGHDDGQYRVV